MDIILLSEGETKYQNIIFYTVINICFCFRLFQYFHLNIDYQFHFRFHLLKHVLFDDCLFFIIIKIG